MSWKSFSQHDHCGSDVIILEVQIRACANDPEFISAIKRFCEQKGYNAFNVQKNGTTVCIKNFASPIAAEGGMKPNPDWTFYVNGSDGGGYAAGSSPAAAAWEFFDNQDHPGSDVVRINMIRGSCGNDPAFQAAIKQFCQAKGYNAFNIRQDGGMFHIKQFGSAIAAKGRLSRMSGWNFYSMPDEPSVPGWNSFPKQDHPGSDVGVLKFDRGAFANDPAFVAAMEQFCAAKGYNAFNVHSSGKTVCLKRFSSAREAEAGMTPMNDWTFHVKK